MAIFWQSWYRAHMETVLLAAGQSARMGEPKLLLPYQGKILALHALEAALSVSDRVIMVTGWYREQLGMAITGLAELKSDRLVFVHNPHPERGQFSSTILGVQALGDCDAFCISMADAPLVTGGHYRTLLDLLGGHEAVRPYCDGIPGHPVLCSAVLRSIITSAPLSDTMRHILATRDVLRYDSDDPAWTTDIDTPEAYRKLLSSSAASGPNRSNHHPDA
ncbi:MAG: nucleotidyltransferase family protein [Sphaerochaetaceae bacterium]|nr:nucleotidyltransferase family protein [Sphaerochaetaceae bacterium]